MPTKVHLLAIIFAALAGTAGAQQPKQAAKTWVLAVGISKYQKLPGGQQLQFADRDAASFAEAIQKRGVSAQNVRLLTGAEATAAAIKSAIGNWLGRSSSEPDTVLIFFSGHGLFEREFGEAYLLGYDSDPKDPYGTAVSVSEIGQALGRRVRAGRVLIIADALRRDFFDPESDPASAQSFEQAFDQLTASRSGISAVLASGPGEFSREGQRWNGHGVFAKHLADVLIEGPDRNGDGALAMDELFEALSARVAQDTSNKQHPWRSGATLAQTVIARIEATAAGSTAKTPPPNAASQSRPAETNKPGEVRATPGEPVVSGQPQKQPVKPTENARAADERPDAPQPVIAGRTEPVARATNKKTDSAPGVPGKGVEAVLIPPSETKTEVVAQPSSEKRVENASTNVTGKPAAVITAPKPAETSGVAPSKPAQPRPSPARAPTPPRTDPIKSLPPSATPPRELARAEIGTAEVSAPPKPPINPPSTATVSSDRSVSPAETLTVSVPAARPEPAPSPLVLQLEAALASKNLLEPKSANAWDFYQHLTADPGAAADAARLKPMLAQALAAQGRAIVGGDMRGDNISDKVDDFKRAGQMLARARSLTPDNAEIVVLEKLSAAGALVSLQFYDEAERALAQIQTVKLAAVENALGLVYQGKLDVWRAERAFKRAIELDSKWASPHYNLALILRGQQNQASLAEFEAAAVLDPGNVNLQTALGEEYFTRQEWRHAAETFRKAVALKPSDDNLHTKLGHALYSQGLQDEANREYQKAQELRRKQP